MQRNILTWKFLKVKSKTHLSIEHWVFKHLSTVEIRHLNRQRPRVQAGVLMLVPFRTLASVLWCSLSSPPVMDEGNVGCISDLESGLVVVYWLRGSSLELPRWCPVNVRQQACFTDCLYFLCALPRWCQCTTHWLLFKWGGECWKGSSYKGN